MFANPVTVGYMYILKLIHMVEDKIHQRSIGPYSLITPTAARRQGWFGGKRFGNGSLGAQAYGAHMPESDNQVRRRAGAE